MPTDEDERKLKDEYPSSFKQRILANEKITDYKYKEIPLKKLLHNLRLDESYSKNKMIIKQSINLSEVNHDPLK